MTMTILNTNVVSELNRDRPHPVVWAWWRRQVIAETFLTAITEAELRYGIAIMPAGRRHDQLSRKINRSLRMDFPGRILPFDSAAARAYAVITANRRAIGRRIEHPDAQIAAIALSQSMAVAIRNTDDFTDSGIEVINPWSTEGTLP